MLFREHPLGSRGRFEPCAWLELILSQARKHIAVVGDWLLAGLDLLADPGDRMM